MIFSFVILHYLTLKDTCECIESIQSIDHNGHQINIIVVDNYSNNGTFEELQNKYNNSKQVFLIHNNENLGFAKGNNVGYSFAKKINSDFIIILNNDIIIKSKNFLEIINKYYIDYDYHVLGPYIKSLSNNKNQNPMKAISMNFLDIVFDIIKLQLYRILNFVGLYNTVQALKDSIKKTSSLEEMNNHSICLNSQLHGSCLVFSKNYISRERYAFYPKTFLYLEESILYVHCKQMSYITIYCPDALVFHKEDSSTNQIYKKNSKKLEFVMKNATNSYLVLANLLLKRKKEWD